jgi:hypothetical protein
MGYRLISVAEQSEVYCILLLRELARGSDPNRDKGTSVTRLISGEGTTTKFAHCFEWEVCD